MDTYVKPGMGAPNTGTAATSARTEMVVKRIMQGWGTYENGSKDYKE